MKLSGIILAAGASRRMGSRNKLLIPIDGQTAIERVVNVLIPWCQGGVLLVTGYEAGAVERVLTDLPVTLRFNPSWKRGMGSSLAAGAKALTGFGGDGVLVCLGDLPYLTPEMVEPVVRRFEAMKGRSIVAPQYQGRQGHPVLFPWSILPQLTRLDGDQGAKPILKANPLEIVEMETDAIWKDIDRPEDLQNGLTD